MKTVPISTKDTYVYIAITDNGDGTCTLYEPADAALLPPAPVMPRIVDASNFRARFTDAELSALATLAYSGTGDVNAAVLLLKVQTATEGVDLDSTSVTQGLQYLVSKNVLLSTRPAQIQG